MAGAIVLVTGSVGAGKTTVLESLYERMRERCRAWGFVSRAHGRAAGRSGGPAEQYRIDVLGEAGDLPWAERSRGGPGFEFDERSLEVLSERARSALSRDALDLFIADEIGRLELASGGIAPIVRDALGRTEGVVVVSVRKGLVGGAVRELGINDPLVIDLDRTGSDEALERLVERLETHDAERMGVFAGVAGLVEVGLGSLLHVWRLPLKGHLLAAIQNVLLVTFGRVLGGRGLVRISLVSAMLKAFSPAGGRLRPMLYIFLQGGAFALPVRLLGWNLLAALAGSILMGWLTLLLSLASKVVTFGQSILEAYASAAALLGSLVGVSSMSVWQLVVFLMAVKAALAVVITLVTYNGRLAPVIERLRRLGARLVPAPAEAEPERRSLRGAALGAARDLVRPRFLLGFIVSVLLLMLLADVSQVTLVGLVARGLVISYLGFVVIRRVDPLALAHWLLRRGHAGLAVSLRSALGVLSARDSTAGRTRGLDVPSEKRD